MSNRISIIGSGYISREWIKSFVYQGNLFKKINLHARDYHKLARLSAEFPEIKTFVMDTAESQKSLSDSDVVILATSINSLSSLSRKLSFTLHRDAYMVLEKPGVSLNNIDSEDWIAGERVFVAYNRRFYNSLDMAKKFIKCNVDYNAFSRIEIGISENFSSIDPVKFSGFSRYDWILANTMHIIDMSNVLMEQLGVNLFDIVEHSRGFRWGVQSRYKCSGKSTGLPMEISICANVDRPGWYFSLFNGDNAFHIKPLEFFNGVNVEENPLNIKPGYALMAKSIAEGDYSKFVKFDSAIRDLRRCKQTFAKDQAYDK